jgi:hypothetical protein
MRIQRSYWAIRFQPSQVLYERFHNPKRSGRKIQRGRGEFRLRSAANVPHFALWFLTMNIELVCDRSQGNTIDRE